MCGHLRPIISPNLPDNALRWVHNPHLPEEQRKRENYTVCSKSPSQEVTPLGFKLESAEILNPCSQPHFILPPERGPATAHCGGKGPHPSLASGGAGESNSGPGPGVTGRPQLSRSCPGSGGPDQAVMRSQRWAALPLGPHACSTSVSSYGQLGASPVTPHLALPSERAPGHGEGAVETLEGAGEPPTRPPPGPQLPALSTRIP